MMLQQNSAQYGRIIRLKTVIVFICLIAIVWTQMQIISAKDTEAADVIRKNKKIMGNVTVLDQDLPGSSHYLGAYKVSLTEVGILKTITVYIQKPSKEIILGVYNDNHNQPEQLIATTARIIPQKGWNKLNVIAPVRLTPGTYWLCYLGHGSSLIVKASSSREGESVYYCGSDFQEFLFRILKGKKPDNFKMSYSKLPLVFPRPSGIGKLQFSLFASLDVDDLTPTPTPTVSPTLTPLPTIVSISSPLPSISPGNDNLAAAIASNNNNITAKTSSPNEIIIGNTNVLSDKVSSSAHFLAAYKVKLTQSAMLQTISIYIEKPTNKLILGVYNENNGKPGSLAATTEKIRPVKGWNTLKVTTPVTLTAGSYWLCFLCHSASFVVRASAGDGECVYYSGSGYREFPFQFPGGKKSHITEMPLVKLPQNFPQPNSSGFRQFSLYAGLQTINTVTPTPTPRPTPTPSPTPTPTLEWYKYQQDKEMIGRSKGTARMLQAPVLNQDVDIANWQGYFVVKQSPDNINYQILPYHTPVATDYYEKNRIKWGLGARYYDLYGTGTLVPVADSPSVKIADILTDRTGLEKVTVDNYNQVGDNARARLYAYQGGKEQLVWISEAFPACYGPVVCCADADNDGQMDIVIAMHYRLVVLNGATGETMMNFAYSNQRNYGFLGVANIDADPFPEFCVISDFSEHIEVIDNNGADLSLKWYKQIEANIFLNNSITLPGGPNSFIDIDNDGMMEIICNIYNYDNDHHWNTMVFNAQNGNVKYELNNCYLNGLADINNDGSYELFTTTTPSLAIPSYGELSVYRMLPNNGPQLLWRYQKARFNISEFSYMPLNANTMAANGRYSIVYGRINSAANPVFFISEPGYQEAEIWKCFGYDSNQQIQNWITIKAPTNSKIDALAVAQEEPADNDGMEILVSVVTRGDPCEALKIINGVADLKQWRRKISFLAGPPVVADLEGDGRMEIITSTGDGVITCFERTGCSQEGSLRIRWRMKGQGMTSDAATKQDGVLIADLDNDHRKEIVFARESANGSASIVAVSPTGCVKWEHVFPGFDGSPPVWNLGGITYWLAGNFTSRNYKDLYVTIRRNKMHSDVGFLLSGMDGHTIWERNGILLPGGNPVQDIRGHGGDRVSCADMDGDGLDELVCAYPDRVYIVDGPSGNPVVIKSTAKILFPDAWVAYAVPVLVDIKDDSAPEIFYGRCSYITALLDNQCNVIWQNDYHPNADNGCGFLEGIGDFNGDGRLEIGGIYRNTTAGGYEFLIYKGYFGASASEPENTINTSSLSTIPQSSSSIPQSSSSVPQVNHNAPNMSGLEKLIVDLEKTYISKSYAKYSDEVTNDKPYAQTTPSPGLLHSSQHENPWKYSLKGLGAPCTDVVTADLDQDGCDEFLFGMGSSLHCIEEQGLKWSVNTVATPGHIALADADMDGLLEIIICTRDGYLKIYK